MSLVSAGCPSKLQTPQEVQDELCEDSQKQFVKTVIHVTRETRR